MSFSFSPTTNTGIGGAAAAPGALGFGARPATTTAPPPAFGTATATTAFGATPAATPAFGAATAATPAFGAAPAAAPAFGAAPAATPAFGAAPAATPAFGAAPAATPAFGAAPAATPAFGAAPTATPAFGTAAGATSAFGAAPTATTGFGAAATQAPTFGAAAPAVGTVAPTFSFSTPATSAPTTAPPAFGFGATTTTAAAGIGSFAFAKPQATTAASLNFNTTTTTATAQPFNTGLKLGTTSTASLGGGGIFGKPAGQPATAAPSTFVGLGGIDVSATQPKLGDNKQDGIKIKETQVPDEIVKTVDALKVYIKQQKTTSSDISRTSTSKFTNVTHEINNLNWALRNMSNSVETNNQQIRLLRQETSKAIQSLEMAQRTQDTPAGLQFEHSAPFQYFQCLVAKYEQDLIALRQKIAHTESLMHALSNPQSISPTDMMRCFRQLSESFMALAGRLQEVHQRVEEQKEHYLNLRRYRLRDATNVFERIDNPPLPSVEPQRISSGPTPFSNITAISSLNKSYTSAAAANSASNAAAK